MRLKLAILVLVVCGVGFVLHERKSALENHLGQIATELGGRHVHVHCQSFAGNLVDIGPEAGTVQFDQSGIPSDTTNLKRPDLRGARPLPARREQCRLRVRVRERGLPAEDLGRRASRPRARPRDLAPARDQ